LPLNHAERFFNNPAQFGTNPHNSAQIGTKKHTTCKQNQAQIKKANQNKLNKNGNKSQLTPKQKSQLKFLTQKTRQTTKNSSQTKPPFLFMKAFLSLKSKLDIISIWKVKVMVKVGAYEVPEGLYYSKDFEWIKIEGDKVRMGITDYAQKSLREIVYAELPSIGTVVKQDEPYGTLESVKAVSDLVAAVSGSIEEVNDEVQSKPETLNEDPYVKGWLIVVKPSNLQAELANIMDFDKAVEWHKAQTK